MGGFSGGFRGGFSVGGFDATFFSDTAGGRAEDPGADGVPVAPGGRKTFLTFNTGGRKGGLVGTAGTVEIVAPTDVLTVVGGAAAVDDDGLEMDGGRKTGIVVTTLSLSECTARRLCLPQGR